MLKKVHFSGPFKAFLEEGEGDWAKMLNTMVSQQQKILDYTGWNTLNPISIVYVLISDFVAENLKANKN